MMYTIDKDSSRDCIYVLKKRFIATQNIKGNLTFVEVGRRRRFLRFPRTSSLIQIFIECEQQNVATVVTVCVLPDSLESYSFLQKGKEVSLLLTLFKAPFA